MTLSRIFAAAFAASMLTASAALAEMPRTMRLDVTHAGGADACPSSERVRESLAVAAGVDPIDASAPARLVVTLAAGADLARGRWELYGADGAKLRERSATVTGSCSQLVAELALSFAVAWETPAVVPCNCHDARHEELLRILLKGYGGGRMDVHAVVMAGGLFSAGLTADPGGGFFVGGEAAGEILRGALEVRVLFPSRAVQEPTKQAFSLTAVTAALVPCARWKVLLGCAFVDVGMFIGGGVTAPPPGIPVIATIGLGPRLAVHVPFAEHFAFRAFADLRIAPAPSQVRFVDTGTTWQSNVVSGLFGVGVAFE